MHPGVKLRHIRVFLAIASLGSLTATASAQGVTQPAVSRSLAELEALLGRTLFDRIGRKLVLTEAGLLFRRHASLGVQALEAGAAALGPGAAGSLRVGVLPTAATRLFPQVALRFHQNRPETVLTVVTGPHAYLVGQLRSGQIDVMLGRMPTASEMADLSFDHLYEEQVVLALRAPHPLAGAAPETALAICPVILPPPDAIIRRNVDDYLASLGLAGLRPAYQTVALSVGRGIVLASDALWFISRGVIADELDQGLMTTLPTGARHLSGAVGITRSQTGAARDDLALLSQIARAAVAGGLHG
jgi:LysR family pca operon transcriptional activator